MLDFFNVLWNELTWWQLVLAVMYIIYSCIRAIGYYEEGFRDYLIRGEKDVRLYHIILFIVDIPALLFGQFIPIIKKVFAIKVFPLKKTDGRR